MSSVLPKETRKLWPWWGHLIACAIWIAIAYQLSRSQAGIDLIGAELLLLFIMIPIGALLAHRAASARTLLLASLKPGSRVSWFLSGNLLRPLLAALVALLGGALLALQLLLPNARTELFITLTGQAVLTVIMLPLILAFFRDRFQPWSQIYVVHGLVIFVTGTAAAAVATLLMPLPELMSLEQSLDSTSFSNSPLIDLLALWPTTTEGLQRMALSHSATIGGWPRVFAHFLYFLLWTPPFLASAAAFVALGLRFGELRRALALPLQSDTPASVAPKALVGLLAVAGTFWALHAFVWVNLDKFVGEQKLAQQVKTTINVVRVGDRYFDAAMATQLFATRPDLSSLKANALDIMCQHADTAFASAKKRGADYVDYYYTMPAAYMRIGLAFTDNPADKMTDEIRGRVFGGDFDKLMVSGTTRVRQAEVMSREVDRLWRESVKELLGQHEVFAADDVEFNVVAEAPSLTSFLAPPKPSVDPKWQGATIVASALLAQGGIEAVAGKASKRIANAPAIQGVMSRIIKGSKLNASSKKVAETAARGATRVGTGVMGAGVATAAGALATKAMLEVEEAGNRKAFENQVASAVDQTRAEFMRKAQCSTAGNARL